MEKSFTPLLVVAGALCDEAGRWLMHRRPRGKDHAGRWEFPGGKVEKGETVLQALERELAEETSLAIDPTSCAAAGFAVSESAVGGRGIVILLYTVTRWTGMIAAPEGGMLDWFTPTEIEPLPKPPLDVELARQLFEKTA